MSKPEPTDHDRKDHPVTITDVKARLQAAACEYSSIEHGPLEVIATYQDNDKVTHHVVINFHPYIDWRVCDVAGDLDSGHITLIERMAGVKDFRNEAKWVAEDYAAQVAAYYLGTRSDHPLPARPTVKRVQFSVTG